MFRKKRHFSLSRYQSGCELIYLGFQATMPESRQLGQQYQLKLNSAFIKIEISYIALHTEQWRLSLPLDSTYFSEGQLTECTLQLCHDVKLAEVMQGMRMSLLAPTPSLQLMSIDDKIRIHHLLLECLLVKSNL